MVPTKGWALPSCWPKVPARAWAAMADRARVASDVATRFFMQSPLGLGTCARRGSTGAPRAYRVAPVFRPAIIGRTRLTDPARLRFMILFPGMGAQEATPQHQPQ